MFYVYLYHVIYVYIVSGPGPRPRGRNIIVIYRDLWGSSRSVRTRTSTHTRYTGPRRPALTYLSRSVPIARARTDA